MLATSTEDADVRDPWVTRMVSQPAVVVSTTLLEPLDWPDATVVRGDAVDVVARLEEEPDVCRCGHTQPVDEPRRHGRRSRRPCPRHVFPVITGQTGADPISWVRPTSTSS
jgi:hypothetical protein